MQNQLRLGIIKRSQEKLPTTSSSESILRSKFLRSAISTRHFDAIDPTQTYKYISLATTLKVTMRQNFRVYRGCRIRRRLRLRRICVCIPVQSVYSSVGTFWSEICGENSSGDNFGSSLAIMSNDGLRLDVGAPDNYS